MNRQNTEEDVETVEINKYETLVEGLTDYFTEEAGLNGPDVVSARGREVWVAKKLVSQLGEDVAMKAYFEGGMAPSHSCAWRSMKWVASHWTCRRQTASFRRPALPEKRLDDANRPWTGASPACIRCGATLAK